jgi:hypothetical protein
MNGRQISPSRSQKMFYEKVERKFSVFAFLRKWRNSPFKHISSCLNRDQLRLHYSFFLSLHVSISIHTVFFLAYARFCRFFSLFGINLSIFVSSYIFSRDFFLLLFYRVSSIVSHFGMSNCQTCLDERLKDGENNDAVCCLRLIQA